MVAAPAVFVESLIGTRIAGRYLVERFLGAGGMGVVAGGVYPELGQKVAIKFLHPSYAADTIVAARFLREARVAVKVKSEHFVRVFDIGRLESGVPYIVMELLSGRELADELRDRGRLSVEEAVDVMLQALTGVAEIHALGIVHRDLKPSNLFIAKSGGRTTVKVLDFGISKESEKAEKAEGASPLTSTDHVLGTPQYMSPEQVRASKDVDLRADIWALGVILYELVTGTIPFNSDGGGAGEIFGKVLYVEPESPNVLRPGLPPGLDAVILKCLHKDRDQRYADAVALAEALAPYAGSKSVHRLEHVQKAAAVGSESLAPPAPEDEHPSLAATMQSSPAAKREQAEVRVKRSNRPPPDPSVVASSPITAMTSSTESSSARRGSRNKILLGFIAFVTLGAIAVVGYAVFRTPPSGLHPATSASAALQPEPTVSSASASAALVSTTITTPEPPPPPSTSQAPKATSVPATKAAPPKKPAVPPSAAPPPPPPPPATGPGPLILDRK